MVNDDLEILKEKIIQEYLDVANYYNNLSFFKTIKLKFFGDNTYYPKLRLLYQSIDKFYSLKYDNLLNVIFNYESICESCDIEINKDKFTQFKNMIVPIIEGYKRTQLLSNKVSKIISCTDTNWAVKRIKEKLDEQFIGIEKYNEPYSPNIIASKRKDGIVNMYTLFTDFANCFEIYEKGIKTEKYDSAEQSILTDRMHEIIKAVETYISNYVHCMNNTNDILAQWDVSKYDKPIDHIKACDFLIWKEFNNYSLYKNYQIPTKDIKEKINTTLSEINNLAQKTIEERTPESYASYKSFLKDKYENLINKYYSHDVSRIHFGEYASKLVSGVLDKGRTYFNSHPININGNKILFNVFTRYKNIVVFDVETTGLDPINDNIIQFACERYSLINSDVKMIDNNDIFIKLPDGKYISKSVESLTNISNETLNSKGISIDKAKQIIKDIFKPTGKTLFVAYNAHFDINFIEKFLETDKTLLYNLDFYDPYVAFSDITYWNVGYGKPEHFENRKLETVIKMLNLNAKNSHNAHDDCHALFEIMKKFEECGMSEYIIKYINYLYEPDIKSLKLPQINYISFNN